MKQIRMVRLIIICSSILLIITLFHTSSFSQTPPHWRFWQASDGLAESCSNSVFCGPSGRVWVNHGHIGTMSVLDGHRIAHIPSPGAGVPVRENPAGSIWSIYEGGFQRFDETRQEWIPYPLEDIQLTTRYFYPIDKDRLIYLQPDRIVEYQITGNETSVIKDSARSQLGRFISLCASKSGTIWISGDYGIARMNPGPNGGSYSWQEYPVAPHLNVRGLDHLVEWDDGRLYCSAVSNVTSLKVLLRFERGKWVTAFEHARIQADWGWEARDNALWIIDSPFSIFHVINADIIIPVESNKVLSRVLLSADPEPDGSFWLATSEGLARYAPPTWQTPSFVSNFNQAAHAIREDRDGRLWFLYTGQLLSLYENEWSQFFLPEGIRSDELQTDALLHWDQDRLAIKTTDGVFLFSKKEHLFERLNHPDGFQISAISPKGPNETWIVSFSDTALHLDLFDGSGWKTVFRKPNPSSLDPQIRHIYQQADGAVWLAGLNGLERHQGDSSHRFTPEDGYTDTGAYCIYPLDDQRLWVGGREALLEYNGKTWTQLLSGLDGVRSIARDADGSMWVASGTGLHRLKDGSWIDNNYEEGLPNAAVFEVYPDRQNRIWAGTTSGLSLYHPDADRDAPETSIPADKNPKEISSSGGQFFYQGMDQWKYTRTERLLYSYRIGTNAWSPFSPGTEQTIQGLPAGIHQIEVRAMDRNWNIDSTPAIHQFTVLRLWYQEPVFQITLGLCILLIAAIAFLIGWIIHNAKQQNRVLAQQVAERTADLTRANEQLQKDSFEIKTAYDKVLEFQKQLRLLSTELSQTEERERRRLATDLHDSIGQSLALAMIKLEGLQESISQSEPSREIEDLKALTDKTLQSTRNLTFELCPPILYEVGFEAAAEQLADQIQTQYDLQIQMEIQCDCQAMREDLRYILFRSLRELLMNVVKHAKTDEAQVTIRRDKESFIAEVRDRGQGFDPGSQPLKTDGFGLFSISERLKQIGGQFIVESTSGEGCCVTIIAPM